MTIKEAAQRTTQIQDACNLSGIVFAMPAVMQAICDEANRTGQGTEFKNGHPIIRAYIDKLCHLAGIQENTFHTLNTAHDACSKLAQES